MTDRSRRARCEGCAFLHIPPSRTPSQRLPPFPQPPFTAALHRRPSPPRTRSSPSPPRPPFPRRRLRSRSQVREGCISFSQWRRYTIVTTGSADASLHLTVSGLSDAGAVSELMPLSRVYARRNKAPTVDEYDVTIGAPRSSFSTSPCYVDDPYEYHLVREAARSR